MSPNEKDDSKTVNQEEEEINREEMDNQESTFVDNISIEMVDVDKKKRVDVTIEMVDEDEKTCVVINNPLDTCDKNNILV